MNLPKTDFPMRANAKVREPELMKIQHDSVYKWQWEKNPGSIFILHDGPPYANGSPHMGHALNKILKDFVSREKMLEGHKVSYIPGWDCHGLPIELKALEAMKKQKKDSKDMSTNQMRTFAREYALGQLEVQKKEFMQYGVLGDWNNPYVTMDPVYEARQIGIFHAMFKRGLIYRGLKPVYWSPSTKTALAEAELEYQDNHESPSVYVTFKSTQLPPKLQIYKDLHAVIWTTTPWTLPANKAIAVNKALTYSIVTLDGKLLIIAKDRVTALKQLLDRDLPILADYSGDDLLGSEFQHPFVDIRVPFLHGDHVTLESGTGLVHTAPGHGKEDYQVCKENGIEPYCPVDDDGRFVKELGAPFAGLFVLKEGNDAVIKILRDHSALLFSHKYVHRYPYDWRSKQPIIVRATKQWFADLHEVKSTAIAAIEEPLVRFIPAAGSRNRLTSFVKSRDDWCISRQRQWGVPIPVFYNVNTDEHLMTDETIEHVQNIIKTHGTDAWFDWPVEKLLPPSLSARASEFKKGVDTMDVWFDSGCSWDAVLAGRGLPNQADVYLEGSDQHRGWFQSSLLTSASVLGRAPYKTVISHGFVLDGNGHKMSKSLGNVIEPSTIINGGKISGEAVQGFGVDTLRLWVASSDYSVDVNVSLRLLNDSSLSLRKLRNTARFILGNIFDYNLSYNEHMKLVNSISLELDQYGLHLVRDFYNNVLQNFMEHSYHNVVKSAMLFCTNDLSSFYFDITKDRLYTSAPAASHRRSAQAVMVEMLFALLRVLTPIVPHLAEDIFAFLPPNLKFGSADAKSVCQLPWHEKQFGRVAPQEVVQRVSLLRDLKAAFNLKFSDLKASDSNIKVFADADVTIKVRKGSETEKTLFTKISEEAKASLGEVFIASHVEWQVVDNLDVDYDLIVVAATTTKCPRCWKKVTKAENMFCNKEVCPN